MERILNVINIERRTDRLLSIAQQAKLHKIAMRIWQGIEDTPIHKGICRSHKQIVQFAKDNNLPFVHIAEDDVVFSAEGSWEYYLQNMPTDADCYFSMIYSGQIENNRIVNGFSGMTLYTVFEKFYSKFLEIPDERHCDRFLGQEAHLNNYQVCPQPYPCLQSGGYSSNLGREMFYDAFTDSMEFFGQEGNVFRKGVWIKKDLV